MGALLPTYMAQMLLLGCIRIDYRFCTCLPYSYTRLPVPTGFLLDYEFEMYTLSVKLNAQER